MKKIILLLLVTLNILITAQNVDPTLSEKRIEAYRQRLNLQQNSLLKNVELRNAGPTIMSGRVVDIDVNPADPTIFYVAYASGGLWKTTNNGNSFAPLFDNRESITIGDIAVDWKHGEVIWVGTGENNSSRSSYAGTGIYKSNDLGKTWQNAGLAETQRTGRIIINPNNPEVILVAALGHLYSVNPERGIYKTTNGGKTWRQTLFINDTTGAIDMVIDPANPDIIYASAWQRIREAWNFTESGSGSGIYKSTDGGETWNLLTTEGSGFPTGNGVGRIGLSIFNKNPQIIFALVDNQFHREKENKEDKHVLTAKQLRNISSTDFLKLEESLVDEFLDEEDFPAEYTAKKIIELVKENKLKPSDLADYLDDAESLLFDTPVTGGELYKSDDGGKTWKKTHEKFLDDFYYSYGYYFGGVIVDPNNDKKIYLLGVPVIVSEDGGKTFKSLTEGNVHLDSHAMWIDPQKSNHLLLGNDGGLNLSYDGGESWLKLNSPPVGQFYAVAVDMAKPYNVYGGLQDNGVWKGPSTYKFSRDWQGEGKYPYEEIISGDGMQVAVDTTDNNLIYTGYQFGYYYRVDMTTKDYAPVKPVHKLGEKPLRFNWQTPIQLSSHNHDIFYLGSNKLHRSLDKGNTFQTISGDLTKGGVKGDVPYGTLSTINESPLKFGLIYTGSDDGLINVTKDGGVTWNRISDDLPENLWVSRVTASCHDTGTVFISLNGYRYDNFESFIFSSTNYGDSWERIGKNLPFEPVNVIKDDPENKNILYVGTDHGLYVSLDAGKTFMALFNGMPSVPVHDLVIHPRDKEIVVGTHGRSIYIADVKYIQQLNEEVLKKKIYLFPVSDKTFDPDWGNRGYPWGEINEPALKIVYYSGINTIVAIKIKAENDSLLIELADTAEHGLNFFSYDLTVDKNKESFYKDFINGNAKIKDEFKETENKKIYLRPGKYNAEIEIDGVKETQTFEIEGKPKKKRGESSPFPREKD